jgi:hypothetical protein
LNYFVSICFCFCQKKISVLFVAVIADYIVEKCEEGSSYWEKVPGTPSGTSHTVKGLEEGKKYKFRVKAANMYGNSEPAELDKSVLAKNPFGKFNVCFKVLFTY